MKQPLMDLETVLAGRWANYTRFKNQFTRYWGTEMVTVDGEQVEVYRYAQDIMNLPAEAENHRDNADIVKLLKSLGAYQDLKDQSWKGITSAWMYLNPKKNGYSDEAEKDNLRQLLSDAIHDLSSGTINISSQITKTVRTDDGYSYTSYNISNPMDVINNITFDLDAIEEIYPGFTELYEEGGYDEEEMLYAKVLLAYQTLWDNHDITTWYEEVEEEDNKYKEVLLMYLLFSADIKYSINKVTTSIELKQVGTHTVTRYDGGGNSVTTVEPDYRPVHTVSIDVKIDTSQIIGLNLDIVDDIHEDVLAVDTAPPSVSVYSSSRTTTLTPSNPRKVAMALDSMFDIGELDAEDEFAGFWVKYDGKWRLRVDAIDGKVRKANGDSFSLKERSAYLQNVIDQGYKKKKASRWKRILAIVIVIVIVVVVTYTTNGTATEAAIAGAQALLYSSLAITVLQAATAAWGYEDTSMALGEANTTLAPAVKIAAIIVMIDGLSQLGEELAKTAAEQGAAAATKQALLSQQSMVINKAITGYYEHELGKISDRNDKMRNEIAELESQYEANLYRDLQQDFIKMYTNKMAQDQAAYQYTDVNYVPVKGPYHIGNIQATNVQAWLHSKV